MVRGKGSRLSIDASLRTVARRFAAHWGFRPPTCAPYRERTNAQDENGVRYVKRNAIGGHGFESPAPLEAHLAWWMREIADVRRHGTTGEAPLPRFERDDAARLAPCAGRPPLGRSGSVQMSTENGAFLGVRPCEDRLRKVGSQG